MLVLNRSFWLLLVFCGTTGAQGVVTEAVSTNANGENANGPSIDPAISADGRFVAFLSIAGNLAPITNGAPQLYLKDRLTGAVALISQSTDGQSADFSSGALTISDDGRYVLFTSGANNLVPGDINDDPSIPDVGGNDIFLRDTWGGTTIRVSESEDGSAWRETTGFAMPNHDYTRIAMEVSQPDLVAGDSDFDEDVFVKDLQSGALTLLSTDSEGALIEGDVRLGYYDPLERFVVLNTATESEAPPDLPDETRGLFFKDLMSGEVRRILNDKDGQFLSGQRISRPRVINQGQTAFFASRDQWVNTPPLPVLAAGEIPLNLIYRTQTTSNEMVSLNEDGELPSLGIINFDVDDSGNLLVMETAAENLHPFGQLSRQFRVYMKDLSTNEIRLVSQSTAGEDSNQPSLGMDPRVSADGRYVVYESSATNLDPIASSGTVRVFVTDMFPERGPPPWALGQGSIAIPALSRWSLVGMGLIFLLIGLSRARLERVGRLHL